MRNYIVFLFFFIISVNVSAQTGEEVKEEKKEEHKKEHKGEEFDHHCLFEEKSITVGLGSSYAFEIESVGINTRFYYNLGEQICFGPEFSFFKTDEEEVYDINLIGHYIFETKFVGIYPLAGINYSIEKIEDHDTEKDTGFVVGAGVHRSFNKFTIFTEYSHVESDLSDDFITIGLMYTLK